MGRRCAVRWESEVARSTDGTEPAGLPSRVHISSGAIDAG